MRKLVDEIGDFDEKVTEEAESGKSLIQSFFQTLKAYRVYEAKHPIVLKLLGCLKQEFDRHFEEFDSFFLKVGRHQLLHQGKVVYESQDFKESLASIFQKQVPNLSVDQPLAQFYALNPDEIEEIYKRAEQVQQPQYVELTTRS